MTERRQKIRGTTAQLDQVIGADGLLAYDTTLKELRVYDGVLQGGYRIPNLLTIDAAYKLPDRLKTTGKTLAGIDVVTVSEAGFYFTTATTIGLPTAAIGTLLVEPAGTGRNITWTRRSTYEKWGRSFDGVSTWTAWQRIVDLNYLTTNAAAKAYDADRLDGQDSAYYTAIVTRLGYTPVNKAGDTGIGALSMSTLTTSGTAAIGTNATVGGTLGVTGAVTLTSTLEVNGNVINIKGTSPRVQLTDTTAAADDFWVYADSDSFYILTDRDDSGNYEVPHPLQLSNVTGIGTLYGNQILTTAMEGSGNGIDSDLLDGQHGAYYRDLVNSTGTLPNARVVGAYNGFTTIGASGLVTLSAAGEALRLDGDGVAGADPYLTFYKVGVRQALIQHTDGAGLASGIRIINEVPASDTSIIITNDGGVDGLRFTSGASNWHVWHSGNLVAADITTLYGYTPLNPTRTLTAGNGLTGGGDLSANRTFTLGTPSDITNSTTNSVTSTSHTHALGFIAAEVYTGSGVNDVSFPLGHSVLIITNTSFVIARNASNGINLSTQSPFDTRFYTHSASGAAGTALSGTWRCRGFIIGDSANNYYMMQRVA